MTNDPKNQKVDFGKLIPKDNINDKMMNELKHTDCGDMPMPEPSLFVIKVTLEKPDKSCLQRIDTLSFNMHVHATFHDEAMRKARDIISEFIPHLKFGTEIILKDGIEVK